MAYVLLLATAFINQLVLMIPVVPLLLAAGALASRGTVHVIPAIASVACGIAAADFVWFQLGRLRGSRILGRVCRLAQEPDTCVRRVQRLFGRYGARALVVAKFIPGLSTVALPLSGMLGMRKLRFVLYDAIGDLLWASAYVTVGYLSAKSVTKLAAPSLRPAARFAPIALAAIAMYILWKFLRRRASSKALGIERVRAEELSRTLEAREDVLFVDLRHPIDVETDPATLAHALQIAAEDLEAFDAGMFRGRDVVLYCTCPNEATSARTALTLRARGIGRVRPLAGGFVEWRARGFRVESRGPATPPALRVLNVR
jgi:membrane protein DedA with SNARE-associated domain/rhodanese-related sulfurtransferase